MRKREYLHQLYAALHDYSDDDKDEIMEEFEEHFADGEKQGKSDEEIIEELGSVQDMIDSFSSQTDHHEEKHASDYMEESYEDITGIAVDGKNARLDVTMQKGDALQVEFEPHAVLFGRQAVLQKERKDNTLYLTVKEGNAELIITVPDQVRETVVQGKSLDLNAQDIHLDNVKIDTVSGDVELNDTDFRNLKFNTVSGDFESSSLKAELVTIDTLSGDAEFNDSTIDFLHFSTKSGDVEFAGHVKKAAFDLVSGDVDLKLASAPDAIEVSAVSGDIEIWFANDDWHASLSTLTGDLESEEIEPSYRRKNCLEAGKGHTKVTCSTVSGDIDLH